MSAVYRTPASEKEFADYFSLRWELLRKPLGLAQGSEQDKLDGKAVHIAAFEGKKIIGVGRLQIEKDNTAQVRYMAVSNSHRRQGIGSQILIELENNAKAKGIEMCWLKARETAIKFYEKNNYLISGDAQSDLKIPHFLMQKIL